MCNTIRMQLNLKYSNDIFIGGFIFSDNQMRTYFRKSVPKINLLVSLLFLLNNAAHASSTVAVEVTKCDWKLITANENIASSTQMGINWKLLLNAMYFGVEYHASRPKFDDPVQLGVTPGTQRKLEVTEVDLTLGYYMYKHLAAYVRYKQLEIDYGTRLLSNTPGIGILGKYTFTNNWLVFANATYYLGELSYNNKHGETEITEIVAGTALRMSLYSFLNLSYSVQQVDFTRNNTFDFELEKTGISLSYNYVF